MKFRAFVLIFLSSTLCLIQTGCRRSASDVWEDAKTCSRQVGRGVKTLTGENTISRQVKSINDFKGPQDNEFIPFKDEDIAYRYASSYQNTNSFSESNAPQPMFEPGESGSGLPGIEGFTCPSTPELRRIFKNIHFDTNEYSIRGTENKEIMGNICNYLKTHPNTYVYVEGHCDQKGPAAYNLALGAKRSNAVRNQLVECGISPDNVHTISYGKEHLLHDDTSAESMKKNRRVEFKLYAKNSRGY
jgi:peptidoglycan-associated lipoprotein